MALEAKGGENLVYCLRDSQTRAPLTIVVGCLD
jgi:hypothetical protein